jgi:hypothetical protein
MDGSMGPGSGMQAASPGQLVPAAPRVPATRGIRRTVLVLGAVILVVAAAAVLVVALTTRPAPTYPAGSPEAAFQGYYTAWEARDLETAYGLLSERIRASVPADQYRRDDRDYAWSRDESRRVVLIASRVVGDRATLDLRIDQSSSGGPFGATDTWSWDTSVALVREDGAWHVDDYLAGLEPMPAFEKQ